MTKSFEQYGKKTTIDEGIFLCREGFELSYVTIILSGVCKVTTQKENGNIMSFGFYKGSGVVGDLETMSDSNIALTSVFSISKVECIRLSLKKSKELVKRDINYCNLIALNLAHKLATSSTQTTQNILLPLEDRLISYLQTTYPDKVFEANLIQISQELGTSYRHLLRIIKKLKDKKILVPTDKKKQYIINL